MTPSPSQRLSAYPCSQTFLFLLSPLDTHLFLANAYSLGWLVKCSDYLIQYVLTMHVIRVSETVRMHQYALSYVHQSECEILTNSWVFITATNCMIVCIVDYPHSTGGICTTILSSVK